MREHGRAVPDDVGRRLPRPDGPALQALDRAWRWQLLPLILLAPEIVAAVPGSRLPKGVRLEDLVRHRCR